MSQSKFPDGWDEGRVQRVLAHYHEQTEDEALAEDEAGIQSSDTVMNVPRDLVPRVRELIAKSQSYFEKVQRLNVPPSEGLAQLEAAPDIQPAPNDRLPRR